MISVHRGQRAFQCEDEHSFFVSYNMINNLVCWWKKTGQNACKWSVFLREKPTSSSTENSMDSGWQTSLWFHRHQFPLGFQHICLSTSQGSSEKCDLQCAHVLPESPSHIKSIWCNLQELSQHHCPRFIPGEGSVFRWTCLNTCENSAPRMWRRLEIWGCTQRLEPSVEH